MAAQKAEAARLQAQQSSNSSKAGKKKNFTGEGLEDNAGDYVYRETVLGGMLGGKSQISLLHMPAGLSRLLRLDGLSQDTIIHWRRMSGFSALWVAGMNHAEIATQVLSENDAAPVGCAVSVVNEAVSVYLKFEGLLMLKLNV
ncbi:hypothetical protein ACH5RR_024852 [Cinchona calisaya]|uniref:Uncharacterized protein n=1 Tax=Cinchona calisaya TaxID=153742 RepID=A0ABD2YXY0_9GENT